MEGKEFRAAVARDKCVQRRGPWGLRDGSVGKDSWAGSLPALLQLPKVSEKEKKNVVMYIYNPNTHRETGGRDKGLARKLLGQLAWSQTLPQSKWKGRNDSSNCPLTLICSFWYVSMNVRPEDNPPAIF